MSSAATFGMHANRSGCTLFAIIEFQNFAADREITIYFVSLTLIKTIIVGGYKSCTLVQV